VSQYLVPEQPIVMKLILDILDTNFQTGRKTM